MQFEVVLRLEGLLADLTLEPPPDAVSGEVTSEVPLARKNLMTRKRAGQASRSKSQDIRHVGLVTTVNSL